MRQGNVFTPVCDSVQGGGSLSRGVLSRGSLSGGLCLGGLCLGGLCRGGGCSVHGGSLSRRGPVQEGPGILLECILVTETFNITIIIQFMRNACASDTAVELLHFGTVIVDLYYIILWNIFKVRKWLRLNLELLKNIRGNFYKVIILRSLF